MLELTTFFIMLRCSDNTNELIINPIMKVQGHVTLIWALPEF